MNASLDKLVFDDDKSILESVLREAFGKHADGLDRAVQVIRHCYNPFGYSYESVLQEAIDGLAAGMGLATRSSAELYEFKYIKSYN